MDTLAFTDLYRDRYAEQYIKVCSAMLNQSLPTWFLPRWMARRKIRALLNLDVPVTPGSTRNKVASVRRGLETRLERLK